MVEFEDRKRSEKILGGRTTKIGVARELGHRRCPNREITKSGTKCAAEGLRGRGGFRGKETTKSGAGGAAEGGPKWLRSKPWREDHEEHRRERPTGRRAKSLSEGDLCPVLGEVWKGWREHISSQSVEKWPHVKLLPCWEASSSKRQGAEPRERGKVSNEAVHLGVNEMVPTSLSSSGRTKAEEMCEDFTRLDQVVSDMDPRQSQGDPKQSRSVVASIANKVHEALKPFSG
ncbi:hypothetical protein TcasGA2_TC006831 [Tribolium castaneum]|uniref:Uncharacterized protein n=1 Tax=Tribolium castaneum TaxID=7070 RepID=D7EI18_TRICA|nr:hypothetical protein TcasGA2_TC006831 [Tribolium castaneum]